MKNNKKTLIMIIGLFIFTIMVGGVSYAYFIYNKDVALADLTSGSINISFDKTANTSSIVSNQPLSDNLGIISPNYLEFTVTGQADIEAIKYELEIVPSNNNTLDGRYVKFYLTEMVNNEEVVLASPILYTELYDSIANNGKGIYQDLVTGNNDGTSKSYEKIYRLRVWVDENYKGTSDNIENTFTYGIYLYAENVDAANYHRLSFDFKDDKTLSKMVAIGEDYGSLPTPYKEGYNFLGWNGKNLLNLDNFVETYAPYQNFASERVIFEGEEVWKIYGHINSAGRNIEYMKNYFNITSRYTFSLNIYDVLSNNNAPRIYLNGIAMTLFYANNDLSQSITLDHNYRINNPETWHKVIVISNNNEISCIKASYNTSRAYSYIKEFQIEEGTSVTPYEPYYVTNNTEVTEWNTEMILKAKYSWNNYRYNDEVQEIDSQDIHGGEMHDDYITLNGTSDYIDVGQVTDKKEVSIQATIKVEDSDLTGEHEIISNDETSGMELDIKDGYVRFSLYLDGYNHYVRMVSSSIIDTASVHDIVGTYDGREMKLYIDGILDNSSFYVDNTLNTTNTLSDIISTNNLTGKIKNSNNNTVMTIGGNPSGSTVTGNYFAGNIYSVRIYDYAIDELKIKTNIRKDGFLAKYNS